MCTKNADFLYIFQVWWTISLWSQIRVQVRKREMRNAGQEDVCATFFSKHWPKVQYWFEFLSFFFQILVEQNILDPLLKNNQEKTTEQICPGIISAHNSAGLFGPLRVPS